ncbi:MAG TPA: TlpA disulfide reductase family protein [Chitinophagaceae bacterium]|jgi:peroxiredoxin|nr:TlpA disulfide reductase family protein [Chitinophagaceae bacterium]
MRKFSLALAVLFFLACKHEASKQFEISGHLKNSNGKMVYLQETPLGSGERIIADSSIIGKDGSYSVKAKATEESLFSLFFKGDVYPFAYIINDVAKIVVNADAESQNDYEVKGSDASKSLKEFSVKVSGKWSALYALGHQIDSLMKSGAGDTSSSVRSINEEGVSQLNDLKSYVSGFIKSSKDPITSSWALSTNSQVFSMDDYQALLHGIVTKFPAHKGVAKIKEMNDRQVALSKQKSQAMEEPEWTNKQAPELSLPDINGKTITLSSFKGKYVLVDFWASWCLPCRKENPNVVQAYNKYKSKNFTVLGVSLDKQKDDWLGAIEADKLSWTQVSDLQEWNSAAVSTFNFNGIPFNVLVDPDGKIIAQSLRGDSLERKLEEVLR